MRNKLRAVLVRNGKNQNDLGRLLGLTKQTIASRMHGKSAFTLDEVKAIKKEYRLSNDEIVDIFLKGK